MAGVAIIVIALLLYRGYKHYLKHSAELRRLREENAQLHAQLQTLREDYERLATRSTEGLGGGGASLSDADRLAQLAEAIRRKEPLM